MFHPDTYEENFTWKTAEITLQHFPKENEMYIVSFSNNTSDQKDKGNGKKLLCYAIRTLLKKYKFNIVTLHPTSNCRMDVPGKYPKENPQAKLEDYYRTKYGFEKVNRSSQMGATPETILKHCEGGGTRKNKRRRRQYGRKGKIPTVRGSRTTSQVSIRGSRGRYDLR